MTYFLKTEDFQGTSLTSAYTPEGHYIGNEEWAKKLEELGIVPELRTPTSNVCSIGFCEREQKWYGWSHRAMYGFGVGSQVKKGDCAYQASAPEDFLQQCLSFWGDCDYHAEATARHAEQDGVKGVLVEWMYNGEVPNEKLRGTISGMFTPYPETWGRGEWKAKTLEDARQMAMDFAEGVS